MSPFAALEYFELGFGTSISPASEEKSNPPNVELLHVDILLLNCKLQKGKKLKVGPDFFFPFSPLSIYTLQPGQQRRKRARVFGTLGDAVRNDTGRFTLGINIPQICLQNYQGVFVAKSGGKSGGKSGPTRFSTRFWDPPEFGS